jgi:C_GCAxxG_C_C family probable redox protein
MIEEIKPKGGYVEPNRAQQLAARGYSSGRAVLLAVCQELGIENETIPKIATAFAVMAIGLRHGQQEPWQQCDKAYALAQELCRRFEQEMGSLRCRELTGMDLSTPEGRKAHMSSDVPIRVCLRAIGTAFDLVIELLERPDPPAADD